METGNVHSLIYYHAFWNSNASGLIWENHWSFWRNKEYTKSQTLKTFILTEVVKNRLGEAATFTIPDVFNVLVLYILVVSPPDYLFSGF